MDQRQAEDLLGEGAGSSRVFGEQVDDATLFSQSFMSAMAKPRTGTHRSGAGQMRGVAGLTRSLM
jgi:hypothetical protein